MAAWLSDVCQRNGRSVFLDLAVRGPGWGNRKLFMLYTGDKTIVSPCWAGALRMCSSRFGLQRPINNACLALRMRKALAHAYPHAPITIQFAHFRLSKPPARICCCAWNPCQLKNWNRSKSRRRRRKNQTQPSEKAVKTICGCTGTRETGRPKRPNWLDLGWPRWTRRRPLKQLLIACV